jgi:phage terminase large subunit
MFVLQTNVVFRHLVNSQKKIIVEQGGTRSGKTYNILMWLIFDYCMNNKGKIVSIVRKTFPAVRASVMRDFFEILSKCNMYSEEFHNKSQFEYYLNGNTIEFMSVDQPQKVRGRKRNILFINEANELDLEDWRQLLLRTTEKVILDFNPSDEFHWIYDEVLIREDVEFYQTTYKDNPFLEQVVIDEIERLKTIDENYWRVYGLGERGQNRSTVFQFIIADIPETAKLKSYGLDFGFSADPSSLVAFYIDGDTIYFDELIYQTGMTNIDIGNAIKSIGIDRRDVIWADSAEPKSIHELYQFGYNVKGTVKGSDSINVGIDMMRRYTIALTKRSLNLIKEFRNYKYIEDKMGRLTNKPVDAFNHGIDACRYAVYNTMSRPNLGRYSIRG